MAAGDIERLIRARIPDAQVTIRDLAGDGDHYAATVIAESFRGKSRVQQHQIVYEALKKTGGNSDGDAMMAAMKGMAFESPRGPISIDPDTRDIVSNIYIRKVVKTDGQLWSEEFETYPDVKDPMKVAAAK